MQDKKPNCLRIIAGGNFTLSPLQEFLPEIEKLLGKKISLSLAPEEQILSLLTQNADILCESQILALFLNPDRFFQKKANKENTTDVVKTLCRTIENFSHEYPGEIFIFLCPSAHLSDQNIRSVERVLQNLKKEKNITIFSYKKINRYHACHTVFNAYTEQQAGVPYSREYYHLLTTCLVRFSESLSNPHKVIAVDCDNTLWTGICGEDKLYELRINHAQKSLQQYLKKKKSEGFLLCLCSNNNQDDVIAVFEKYTDMVLSLSDIDAFQINWKPKHEKLRALSTELSLGLSSFLFIDDNPLEVSEIKHTLPMVSALIWPPEQKEALHFLKHLWPLDKLKTTQEDRARSDAYKTERVRKNLQKRSLSQAEFLKTLNIQVNAKPAKDFSRLSQLSWRVNQFRFNNLRLSTNQIYQYTQKSSYYVYEISMQDCFGDYGVTGFVLIKIKNSILEILEMCLSCRVLGRSVEKTVFDFLQKIANNFDCNAMIVSPLRTEKNRPAINFLESIEPKTAITKNKKIIFNISIVETLSVKKISDHDLDNILIKDVKLKKIDYQKIIEFMGSFPRKRSNSLRATSIEEDLIAIWKSVNNKEYIENVTFLEQAESIEILFFASKIHDVFGCHLELVDIFKSQYISLLGNFIKKQTKFFEKTDTLKNIYPLTAQQKILYSSIKLYDEDVYDFYHYWNMSNVDDIGAIEDKLWKIIESIPELRASINNQNNVVIAKVSEADKKKYIKVIKCDSDQLTALCREQIKKHSSLYQTPASRFFIFHANNRQAIVVLKINHIFFDQFSIDNFITKNLNKNKSLNFKELPSLEACAIAEKESFRKIASKNLNYFVKEYSLALPFDFPTMRDRMPLYTCCSVESKTPGSVCDTLAALKNKLELSLFELVFSAFSATLLHYRNTDEAFIVGTAVTNRDLYLSGDKLFGPIFSILPLRIHYNKKFLMGDWAKQMSRVFKKNMRHKCFRSEELVQKIGAERIEGKHPLFPILFVWSDSRIPDYAQEDFFIDDYYFEVQKTEFDMIVYVDNHNGELRLRIDYAKELYDIEQMRQFLMLFQRLLTRFDIDRMDWPLHKLTDKPIRHYGPENANFTNHSVWELIESQVNTSFNKTAIQTLNSTLSYGELKDEVDKYSAYLRNTFKDKKIVVFNIKNQVRHIFLFLAAFRIGLCFIPVSDELLTYLLPLKTELQNTPILTDHALTHVEKYSGDIHLLPDDLPVAHKTKKEKHLNTGIAYKIYTSGSTGVSKAVEIMYQSVVNVIKDFKIRLHADALTRMLVHTSSTFDISVLEILLPLISGGCCIIAEKERARDPQLLADFINLTQCNLIQATPATWQLLLSAYWNNPNRAVLLVGGEKLTDSLASQLKKMSDEVWNVYGPTETTIWSMTYKIENNRRICLGTPISNTYCFVRNTMGFYSPPGSFGELFIGGDGVARGYWNSDENTGKRFLRDDVNGKTVYHTGDVVWIDPQEGSLVFAGRKDRQIKRAGRRIELAEIERGLIGLWGIQQAAVVYKESCEKVYGFVVLNDKCLLMDDVRKEVFEKIPRHLAPDILQFLETMPLTQNGKVDYAALSQFNIQIIPEKIDLSSAPLFVWITHWCRTHLNISTVRITDNFFSLGGNSLLAVTLTKDISGYAGKNIKVTDIFRYPVFQDLISHLTEESGLFHLSYSETSNRSSAVGNEKIAIIGLAIKLPTINNPEEFLKLLSNKSSTVKRFTTQELIKLGVPEKLIHLNGFTPVFSHIDDQLKFDADFFGMSPREASQTDPQHRILMELTWQALEDACIELSPECNSIGIYASCADHHALSENTPNILSREKLSLEIASGESFLATKIAHQLNLHGPAISVNTTCSSGLTCIAEACKSLRAGEADVMIAAAASVTPSEQIGYLYEQGHIFSKTGHCLPFSENADGTVPGSAAVVMILKSLTSALKDKNPIYAVIEGSATNNDGARKASYTSPSATGHAECIRKALKNSAIDQNAIAFIESHGTGTYIGDPIEAEAFQKGYHELRSTCLIGSVKANVGHTNIAAGLVGLAKLCLSRKNNILPGHAGIKTSDPIAHFNNYFHPLVDTIAWPTNKPFAGISSLGIGGTNHHLIIGPSPNVFVKNSNTALHYTLPLAAKNPQSLIALKNKIHRFILENKFTDKSEQLYSLCNVFLFKRKHFDTRFICVFENMEFLLDALQSKDFLYIENTHAAMSMQEFAIQWQRGEFVNWRSVYKDPVSFIHAPGYAFDHTREYDIKNQDIKFIEAISSEFSEKTPVLDEIKCIFEDLLGYEYVENDKNFFDLGGDSLSGLDLIAHVEKKLAISLSMDDLYTHGSIAGLTNVVQKKQAERPAVELIELNNNQNAPVLILVHPGNGNIYHYRALASALSQHFHIYAISYPVGREEFHSLADMAQCYVELIRSLLEQGRDYFLSGWSYGATVAQEMLCQLKKTNMKLPKKLILIDGWADYTEKLLEKNHFFEAFFEPSNLVNQTPEKNMWLDVFWKKVSNRMRILVNHKPQSVDHDAILIKAAVYPKHYVSEDLKYNGWEKYMTHFLETHMILGDHNTIMEQPYLNDVTKIFLNAVKK